MQDEILKHTKKIYKTAKNPNHTFREKTTEIIIEIFIIVFAVTLSIWLHGWSEHRHQQAEAKDFLMDVKADLIKDISKMNNEKLHLLTAIKDYDTLKNLSKQHIDSIKNQAVNFHIITRKMNNGNYEGYKSSGKIGYIENDELKSLILDYYQENMPPLEDVEKSYNERIYALIELLGLSNNLKDAIIQPIVKSKLNLNRQTAVSLIEGYEENILLAKEINLMINKIKN